MTKKVESVLLLADRFNPKAIGYEKELKSLLSAENIAAEVTPYVYVLDSVDLIVVLGGDGFMLKTINSLYKFNKPFLGINFGSRRGFLLNNQRENVVDLIKKGRFTLLKSPLLHVRAISGRVAYENVSANDICVERQVPQCAKLNIKIDGISAGKEVMADGLVVSTALGSTAYNLSAGGSVVHPLSEVLCVNALYEIWPRTFPPLVLPWDITVKIQVLEPEKRKVRVTSGEMFSYENITEAVIKKYDKSFLLVMLEGEDFLRRISQKIMKVQEG